MATAVSIRGSLALWPRYVHVRESGKCSCDAVVMSTPSPLLMMSCVHTTATFCDHLMGVGGLAVSCNSMLYTIRWREMIDMRVCLPQSQDEVQASDGGGAYLKNATLHKVLAELELLLTTAMNRYIQLSGCSAALNAQTQPAVIPWRSDSLLDALALNHAVCGSTQPFRGQWLGYSIH